MKPTPRVLVKTEAARLRLRERGISQNHLALKTAVSRGYLSQLLSRQRHPRATVQQRLMAELRATDPDELFEVVP